MSYSKHLKAGGIVVGIIISVMIPLEMIHALLWILKHIYLLSEHLLTILVTHFFETGRRTTDYIVAYTMIALGALFALKMLSATKSLFHKLLKTLPTWRQQNSAAIETGWNRTPKLNLVKWLLGMYAGMTLIAVTSF